MSLRNMRRTTALLCAALLLAGLGACGKKGDIEPPPGTKSEFPHQYPRYTR